MSRAGKKSESLSDGNSFYFLERPTQGISLREQDGETDTADMQLPLIQNLSTQEANRIKSLSTSERLRIYSRLSGVHAWLNPTSGQQLCEQILDIIRCILQLETIEQTLEIPTCKSGKRKGHVAREHEGKLPAHSQSRYIKKVYEPIMESINLSSDPAKKFHASSNEGSNQHQLPIFQTFWRDYFLSYQKYIHRVALLSSCTVSKAREHAVKLGLNFKITLDNINKFVKENNSKKDHQKVKQYLNNLPSNSKEAELDFSLVPEPLHWLVFDKATREKELERARQKKIHRQESQT